MAVRKKSLPVAAALASPGAAARELATLYTGSGRLFAAQLTRAAELVEAAGGRAWAEREAQEHIGRALDQLTAARARRTCGGGAGHPGAFDHPPGPLTRLRGDLHV
ncbi:hypothetical protein OG389_00085 [Streptomyces sp. NBC_00435]